MYGEGHKQTQQVQHVGSYLLLERPVGRALAVGQGTGRKRAAAAQGKEQVGSRQVRHQGKGQVGSLQGQGPQGRVRNPAAGEPVRQGTVLQMHRVRETVGPMSSTAEIMQRADGGSCTHPVGSPRPVVQVGNHLSVIACWSGDHSGSEMVRGLATPPVLSTTAALKHECAPAAGYPPGAPPGAAPAAASLLAKPIVC